MELPALREWSISGRLGRVRARAYRARGHDGGLKPSEPDDLFGHALSAGDFNNNGAADLAVGVPHEAIGPRFPAGAVNVLYGGAGGLTGTGSQGFWQGTGAWPARPKPTGALGPSQAAGWWLGPSVDGHA